MHIVTSDAAEHFENSAACKGYSLGSLKNDLDTAVIEISGRYPEKGFLLNQICKEAVYVLEGSGALIGSDKETVFKAGDAIYVNNNEKFAWSGRFKAVFVVSPAFDAGQHLEVKT